MEYLIYGDCLQYCRLYNSNPYVDEYIEYSINRSDNCIIHRWDIEGYILHNRKGAAVITYYDNIYKIEQWYIDGEFRKNGPSIVTYYSNGKLAEERWFNRLGLHRIDGPALTYYSKCGRELNREYYINGCRHRWFYPAYISSSYSTTKIHRIYWVWYIYNRKIWSIYTHDVYGEMFIFLLVTLIIAKFYYYGHDPIIVL